MENLIPSMSFITKIHNLLYGQQLDYIDNNPDKHDTVIQYHFQEIHQINDIPATVIIFSEFSYDIFTRMYTISNVHYKIISNVTGINNLILYQSCSFYNRTINPLEALTICIRDLYMKLPKFKVSRNTGQIFVYNENDIDEELDGKYLMGEDCSVCFEKTLTKTPCKHFLCLHCWSKLGNQHYILCPICRERILIKYNPFTENLLSTYEDTDTDTDIDSDGHGHGQGHENSDEISSNIENVSTSGDETNMDDVNQYAEDGISSVESNDSNSML